MIKRLVGIAGLAVLVSRALRAMSPGRAQTGKAVGAEAAKPAATHMAPGFERRLVSIFHVVNRYVEWHRLPTPLAVLNLLAYRVELREQNLHDTSPARPKGDGETPRDPHALFSRTVDGTFNDLEDPGMGKAGVRFGRNVPLEYTFPEAAPALFTPSPRLVSRKLMTRETFTPATTLNLLAAAWIQFMTHDWFNHGKNQRDSFLEVETPEGDTWFEQPMRIQRTMADPTRTHDEEGKPPAYVNVVSHWWDGSAIYGSDEETLKKVRAGVDGKLIIANGRLPVDPTTGLSITGFNENWWVGLGLLHTLFTLEHNAIANRLKQEYAHWSDERLFQTARLVNAALMAKIHTVEWTPGILGHPALQIGMRANWWGLATERVYRLFGRISKDEAISGIPGSPTDHHGVPFTLTEEFASVYRLHPLLPDDIEVYSMRNGKLLKSLGFLEVAKENAAKVIDDKASVIDVLYSFGTSHPGAIILHNYPRFLQDFVTQDGVRVDMASVDVMRDRERGVPRYNQFRKLLHKAPVRSFEELTPNTRWQRELREVYDNDIDRVDTQVGMFAETPPKGFGFSDTAFRIFILMASRRLKSDRFFTTDFNPRVYTEAGMEWIDRNDMTSILLRHYPELTATLRHSKNAFAPWPKVH